MPNVYIISALKELPILKDRLKTVREQLARYSSGTANFLPEFKTPEEQTKQVKALVQSGEALVGRYVSLKRNIAYTNVMSKLTIEGREYSIAELITIRKEMGQELSRVYAALSDENGKRQLMQMNVSALQNAQDKVQTVLYYDEKEKNKKADSWYTFVSKIDAELEIFNARTLLLSADTGELYEDK